MKHLISPLDLSVAETDAILALADDIMARPGAYAHACEGKKLATLFFEPSTRTRLSFEAAMLELGGQVLGFSSANSSSAAKGETVADTVRIVGCYADIIAMRHPKEGAATVATRFATCPIINAGDGGHQHPTQTLTDLLTIHRLKGRLDHLTVGLCGDLKYGRTVHSLIRAMMRCEGTRFVLVNPAELALPSYLLAELDAAGVPYTCTEDLEAAIGGMDILYMTRVQQERFADKAEYLRLRDRYLLDTAKMALAKEDMIVLHPLPRVNEIAPDVDLDPRAAYFKQALCGKYVRMALILTLLQAAQGEPDRRGETHKRPLPAGAFLGGHTCRNPHCITTVEQGIEPVFLQEEDGPVRCWYCEHEAQ